MKRIEAGTAVMQGRLLSFLCSLSQGKKRGGYEIESCVNYEWLDIIYKIFQNIWRKDDGKKI